MGRDTLVVIGNGFTCNLLKNSSKNCTLNSSKPLSNFNSNNINQECLKYIPELEKIIEEEKKISPDNDFECFESILNKYKDNQKLLCYLRRFIAFQYSKFFIEGKEYINFEDWQWTNWFNNNMNNIIGFYDLNYDLFLEAMLNKLDVKFHRVSTPEYIKVVSKGEEGKSIPIFKVHGSIDFDLDVDFICLGNAASIWRSVTEFNTRSGRYHIPHVDIVGNKDLCSPRCQIDLIPPNSKNFYINVPWIDVMYRKLKYLLKDINKIVCFGFSYSPFDRPEFKMILDYCKNKDLIVYDLNRELNSDLRDEVINRQYK